MSVSSESRRETTVNYPMQGAYVTHGNEVRAFATVPEEQSAVANDRLSQLPAV